MPEDQIATHFANPLTIPLVTRGISSTETKKFRKTTLILQV